MQITPASKQLVSFCSTSSSHTRLAERIGLEEYLTDMLDLTGQTDKKKVTTGIMASNFTTNYNEIDSSAARFI